MVLKEGGSDDAFVDHHGTTVWSGQHAEDQKRTLCGGLGSRLVWKGE